MRRLPYVPTLALLAVTSRALAAPPSNVLVNNPATDTATINTQTDPAILRLGASLLLTAFVDTKTANSYTAFSRSTDNGATWEYVGVPTGTPFDGGSPSWAVGYFGSIMLASYRSTSGNNVSRTTDGGVSFALPANASPSCASCATGVIAAAGATSYFGYADFGTETGTNWTVRLTKSTDDGLTWEPDGGALVTTLDGHGVVPVPLPDSSLLVAYVELPNANPNVLRCQRSTDGGTTFASPVAIATLHVSGQYTGGAYRVNTYPRVAVNPANGHVYAVWNDPAQASGGDRGDIFFSRSTDLGSTWSAAQKVNADGTTETQFTPSLTVTPDGKHVLVSWYHDHATDPPLEYRGRIGTVANGAVSFGAEFPISDVRFAAVYGVDVRMQPETMVNHNRMTANNTGFDVVWADGRDTLPSSSTHNQNIRYSRILVSPPRGDFNGSYAIDVSDVFALINHLFASGPAPVGPCQADANADTQETVLDVFTLINFLFAGGAIPGPAC